jgi:hypothetical protein
MPHTRRQDTASGDDATALVEAMYLGRAAADLTASVAGIGRCMAGLWPGPFVVGPELSPSTITTR